MHILIRNYVDKKIAILKSYKNITPGFEEQINQAIELTKQSGVQHARISRVFKISVGHEDIKRVKAGRIDSETIGFPDSVTQHVSSAEESYQRLKNNYRQLRADVGTSSNQAKVAAMQPQAINLVTILESKILGVRSISDINTIIATLQNVSQICDIGSKMTNNNILDAISQITDLAKQTTERYASAKSTKELLLFSAALEAWVGVANKMIDYADVDGGWSFYDFK